MLLHYVIYIDEATVNERHEWGDGETVPLGVLSMAILEPDCGEVMASIQFRGKEEELVAIMRARSEARMDAIQRGAKPEGGVIPNMRVDVIMVKY